MFAGGAGPEVVFFLFEHVPFECHIAVAMCGVQQLQGLQLISSRQKEKKTHHFSALSFMQSLATEGAMRRLLLSTRRVSKATTVTPSQQQQQHTVAAERRAGRKAWLVLFTF